MAVAFPSFCGWVELSPLDGSGGARRPVRVIVRRDGRQNSPEAIEEFFRSADTQVAFGLEDTAFHPKDYLFYTGKRFTVLTSSANATYAGLTPERRRRGDRHASRRGERRGGSEGHRRFLSGAGRTRRSWMRRCWRRSRRRRRRARVCRRRLGAEHQRTLHGLRRRPHPEDSQGAGEGGVQSVCLHAAALSLREQNSRTSTEMERVDTPLERAARGQWDEPWRFELKMQAARFLTGNKGGQLSNARTEILPHQIFAAHRVVRSATAAFPAGR